MKKTKKYLVLFLSLLMMLSTVNVFAQKNERKNIALNGIIINDHIVYSDVDPYIKKSRTYVPIRFIAEELGYDVSWDGDARKVTMTEGNTKVELTIDSKNMYVNGNRITLDAPAEITDSRTFVPLRAIAEAFGENVDYSNDYRAVYIGENPKYNAFYKVVYYYDNKGSVISKYTINLATDKMDANGNVKRFDTTRDLTDTVFDDFYKYGKNGTSKFGVTSYNSSENKKPAAPVAIENKKPSGQKSLADESEDAKKQNSLKNIGPLLVGRWHGKDTYEDEEADVYAEITNVEKNKFKIIYKIVLTEDPKSKFYKDQIGYYREDGKYLDLNWPGDSYGQTGFFYGKHPGIRTSNLYISEDNMRIFWGELGSKYYLDKE